MNKRQAKKFATPGYDFKHGLYRRLKAKCKEMGIWKVCVSQYENYLKWHETMAKEIEND